MQLKPNWVPVDQMPDEWKDGRDLLGWWIDGSFADVYWSREFGEMSFCDAGGRATPTHVAMIAGPDEEPQR